MMFPLKPVTKFTFESNAEWAHHEMKRLLWSEKHGLKATLVTLDSIVRTIEPQ